MSSISGINNISSSLYGQIASGNRLTSAAQGASELVISQKENTQIRGYNTATGNLESGKDLLNISDGALSSVTDYLQRIRELALQASNTAVVSDSDRANIQKEVEQLKLGIQDVATQTQYNTLNLLDGSISDGLKIAADANGSSITINSSVNSTLEALGIADFDVTKNFDLQTIDNALNMVSDSRSSIGAQSNTLDYAINYNKYASYNITVANSKIADTDYTKAVEEMKKQQVLQTYSLLMQKKKMEAEERKAINLWA